MWRLIAYQGFALVHQQVGLNGTGSRLSVQEAPISKFKYVSERVLVSASRCTEWAAIPFNQSRSKLQTLQYIDGGS